MSTCIRLDLSAGDTALSRTGLAAVAEENNAVVVSAATAWEIATKFRIGKLPGVAAIVADLASALDTQGFVPLPIAFGHGRTAGAWPGPLRDPFDRMLIAQAMLEDMALVSNRKTSAPTVVRRAW